MRIIIEDDYRFVGAAPSQANALPYQTPQALPYQAAQPGPYQTPQGGPYQAAQAGPYYQTPQAGSYQNQQAPFMQSAPAAAPNTNDVRNGGEPASYVRQHVVSQAVSTDLFGGRNLSAAANQVLDTVDIGPAPEWLKRVSVTVRELGKTPTS
jgi:hypothetical protein